MNKTKDIKKYRREYYEKHRDALLAANKNWMGNNKARRKSYREIRREEDSRYNREWATAHPECILEKNRRYAKNHPGRVAATELVRRHVDSGKITRPRFCSSCAKEGRIVGHHEDYSKPLQVEWLCERCHSKRHQPRETEMSYRENIFVESMCST